MRHFARISASVFAGVFAFALTFLMAVYLQTALYGEKSLENDAGPQFGVVALAALLGVLAAIVTFAKVFARLRERRSNMAPK